MTVIADPLNALNSLQKALNDGLETHPCSQRPDLRMLLDAPNGRQRFTYALIDKREVLAIAMLLMTEPNEGVPCVQVGYAVAAPYRSQGLASRVLANGIDEFRIGMGRQGMVKFWAEAIVGKANLASQRVAEKVLATSPEDVIDCHSGEPAVSYTKLFQG